MAMRPDAGTPASSAAARATSARSASANNAVAPESPRMYASSAAVRWVLSGTYCQPPWNTASSTWNSSAELRVSVATGSNGCTPRARSACTSWFAPASSSPAVHARPVASTSARRSGSARAAAQNPLGTCSPTFPLRTPLRVVRESRARVARDPTHVAITPERTARSRDDVGIAHNRGVDEVDERRACAMVPSSFDTVRCVTHSARRSMTGQMDVGVVRCGPFTNRGDPWAIRAAIEELAPYDVHGLRHHAGARRVDVRRDVATEQLWQRAARRHEGLDQGRHPARRLHCDQGLRRLHFGDTQAISKVFVDDINKNGGIDGRKIVPVYKKYPPIPGQKPDPLSLCTSFAEDDKVFAVVGVFIDFTGQAPGVRDARSTTRPHRPRARSAVDRRGRRPGSC